MSTAAATVPLHDLACERALIGACILESDWGRNPMARVAPIVRTGDFYAEVHQRVWTVLGELGAEADTTRITGALHDRGWFNEGAIDVVFKATLEVPVCAHVEAYAERVSRLASLRAIDAVARSVRGDLHDGSAIIDPSSVAASAQAALSSAMAGLNRTPPGYGHATIAAVAIEAAEALSAADGGKTLDISIPWGIAELDAIAERPRGAITTLAGWPGTGKSSLAATLWMRDANAGLRPHYVCLEDNRQVLILRVLAQIAGVPIGVVRDILAHGPRADYGRDVIDRIGEAAVRKSALAGTIDDTPGVSAAAIAQRMRQLARDGCRSVFIDYALLMGHDPRIQAPHERITDSIRKVGAAARETGQAVCLLTQLRKLEGGVTRRPTIGDLQGTGTFAQDSRLVALIHREELDEDRDCGPAYVDVCKANHGRTGKAWLVFDGSLTLWRSARVSEVSEVSEAKRRGKR